MNTHINLNACFCLTTNLHNFGCSCVVTTSFYVTRMYYWGNWYIDSNSLLMKRPSCITLDHHCCLWCHIQEDQLKLKPSMVPNVGGTLDTILADNQRFVEAEGNIKRVKEFNNTLYLPFFNLPLS